jgi:hypothetical protein
MREHGLHHKRRRFRVVTTGSKHNYPVAPNVVERDLEATVSGVSKSQVSRLMRCLSSIPAIDL